MTRVRELSSMLPLMEEGDNEIRQGQKSIQATPPQGSLNLSANQLSNVNERVRHMLTS